MTAIPAYEKLGVFYLGRKFDLVGRKLLDEDVLYDTKDLTTHALCVGMTGSGKTGLCLALLEEAAIDGIPAICVDPKGDLGNLLLSFPNLQPSDFQPWIEPGEAARQGVELGDLASQTATKWRDGLASWGQEPSRIQKFRDSVDINIYTPGSNIGLPLTVLKSFDAPPASVLDDAETMREKISGAASGLLTLLGMEADPLTSREHILLSNIFDRAWRDGKNLDLPELIRQIQTPPIKQIGVLDLESFFSTDKRVAFAMSLNNLLASPAFAGWLEGEPLDIKKLLYTADGKPRISILSIAHLNDTERMFFVTMLLGELLSWVRSQPGTSSLRALFYMDEVAGYFPPVAKPPSKPPMLTLLKQARAFGLGIVLATQNPVDLDYKGLSNMGTWLLGRLQTQRDKDRVLDGLEGAASQTGSKFDRAAMEQTLSALGSRVFLMNNVHDDSPTIFQSRWALSFLRGPLSREHIKTLMADRRTKSTPKSAGSSASASDSAPSSSSGSPATQSSSSRPIVPADVNERFWVPNKVPKANSKTIYRPAILGQASLHFVRATASIDYWQDYSLLIPCENGLPDPVWSTCIELPPDHLELGMQPEDGLSFGELPPEMSAARSYKAWDKELKEYLYRHYVVKIYRNEQLKRCSKPNQSEADARIELAQLAREARDLEVEKLRSKYATKLKAFETKIAAAEQRLEKEKAQAKQETLHSMLNMGSSILGALLGNKVASKTNVSKAATAARGIGKAMQQRGDVGRVEETLETLQAEREQLEQECQAEIDQLSSAFNAENLQLETIEIPSKKSDIRVNLLTLVWIPWQIEPSGIATPLVEIPNARTAT
jgi:Bacterial protein of unknown function (DUF853)